MPSISEKVITENSTLEELVAARQIAENTLCDVKAQADVMRILHAKKVLQSAFPQHENAMFARNWDQDEPSLVSLLSEDPRVDDIKIGDDLTDLLDEQKKAVIAAESAVILIGNDDDIWVYAYGADDESDEEHAYAFNMALRPNTALIAPDDISTTEKQE
jgi:hypothetical protein